MLVYISDESSLNESQLDLLVPITDKVSEFRHKSPKAATRRLADRPLKFAEDRFRESEMCRLSCVINFAHAPFSWKNLAAHNAGVTVIIVGFSRAPKMRSG